MSGVDQAFLWGAQETHSIRLGQCFPIPRRECPLHGSMAAGPGPRHKKPAVAYSHRDNQNDKMPLCTSAQAAPSCPQGQSDSNTGAPGTGQMPQITENLQNHTQTFLWETTDSDSLTNVAAGLWEGPRTFPGFGWGIQLRSRCRVHGDARLPKEIRVLGECGAGLSRSRCRTWEFLAGWLAGKWRIPKIRYSPSLPLKLEYQAQNTQE